MKFPLKEILIFLALAVVIVIGFLIFAVWLAI